MKQYLLLILILLFAVGSSFLMHLPAIIKTKEGFQFQRVLGDYPISQTQKGILGDCNYKFTEDTSVPNISAGQIWKEYPIVQVGSYDQTTNNIRYPITPDEGTCMPAEFCDSFYKKNYSMPSNIVTPLDPLSEEQGTRINYYWST